MSLEKVNKAIEQLEAINFHQEYAYEKAILAFLSIKELPIILYDLPLGTIVFRARTHETNSLFKSVEEVSFPPNNYVNCFARCNRPFQSKFYCSENRPTSYMELLENWIETKDFGENFYVSIGRWKLKRSLTTIIVTTPDIANRISTFDKYHGEYMDAFLENCKPEIRKATTILYRYLFDKFRASAKHDPKTYIITAAYCNIALTQNIGKADGIFYPSVQTVAQGINFAINSDFVKYENMELTHLIRNEISINEIYNKKYSFLETDLIAATKIDMINNVIDW